MVGEQKHESMVQSGIKKMLATIGVQGIILALSFVTGLIMPERMGPEMYGYWQIYTFYLAYLNLFGIGFSDGMALYYGGREYNQLPFSRIRGGTGLVGLFILLMTTILFLLAGRMPDPSSRFIYQMLALNIPLSCIPATVVSTASAVNRTSLYNGLNLLVRLLTVTVYIILMLLMIIDFRLVILGDTVARVLYAVVCLIVGRKLFFGKRGPLSEGIAELREKSSAGMNITLAAIAAGIMPVAGKFVVQISASVKAYGEYSFGMSLLHIVITFTSAAGLVIFPLLKKLGNKELAKHYPELSFACGALIFVAMFLYLPAKWLINWYLQEYQAVLEYLHVLLAICVPLGRLQLLLLSYYKALRLERPYFIANIIGVVAIIGATWTVYYFTESIFAVAAVSTTVYNIWCLLLERYLLRNLGQLKGFLKNSLTDVLMMICFIVLASSGRSLVFAVGYAAACMLYIMCHFRTIKGMLGARAKKRDNNMV
nr:hypothetical protein [bacterium]